MRLFAYFTLAALSCGVAFGQPGPPAPAFEIADVHVSPHSNNPSVRGGMVRAGQYELRTATMLNLISRAYEINPANIAGGPSWIETDRFDIIAKVPASATPDLLKLMLQTLLADRFKLVLHRDNKSMTAWVLTAGKRPLLKQSDGTGAGGCEPQESDYTDVINGSFLCHNVTLAEFAQTLESWPRAPVRSYIGANLVRDLTGLKGTWDFHIKWTGRGPLTSAGSDGITLFDAVEKQLGLKLESQKTPISVIAVDSVNEKPTDNLPGLTQKLPPLPTEFEVAEIRPSAPGTQENDMQLHPGGRITASGVSLNYLVQFAWSIDADDLMSGPKWMADQHYDLIAKTPTDAGADGERLSLMLRALLADRFKLAVHTEEQPVNVYALVAVNSTAGSSKLKAADPSNRSGCKYTGGVPGVASALLRNNICQNVTMSQLADWLQATRNQARMYMDHPIVDETGIAGARDFTLVYSGFLAFQSGPGRAGDNNGTVAATDPTGAIPLSEALEKQLGLKVELRKHPMPVLVVDHAEQKSTDN